TINGCYSAGGSLKLLTSTRPACPQGDTPIAWNEAGVPGPQGAIGPQGPQGPQGPAGTVTGYQVVTQSSTLDSGPGSESRFVQCPAGKVVTGGGYEIGFSNGNRLNFSLPGTDPTTGRQEWGINMTLDEDNPTPVTVYAICINGS